MKTQSLLNIKSILIQFLQKKEKYDNNKFKESDFVDNIKLLGLYFKHMFIEDYKLTPIDEKYFFQKIS